MTDTERLADRIEQRLYRTALTDEDRAFIERLDLFFLATVNSRGEPSCSCKGGDPGFVRVLDPTTLMFPCHDGSTSTHSSSGRNSFPMTIASHPCLAGSRQSGHATCCRSLVSQGASRERGTRAQ